MITNRSDGQRFVATAGLTEIEKLQKPTINLDLLPNKEWHGSAPTREESLRPIGDFKTTDDGKITVFGFASDVISDRSIDSPPQFTPPINIQFVKSTVPLTAMHQTDFRQERTGIPGTMRPLFLSTSINFHSLKSGRGEETVSFNAPIFEAAWKSPYNNLEPYLTLEPGYWHQNSGYALQEVHGGVRYRWLEHFSPFIGYFSYGLTGTNPSGSSRLGSVAGISTGIYGFLRIENFLMRGWLSGISTSPFSMDSYFEISKVINFANSDRGFFLGLFSGYTVYRQELQNLARTAETFSESRFKIGITAGLAGPDYLSFSPRIQATPASDTSLTAHQDAKDDADNSDTINKNQNLRASPLFVATGEYRIGLDLKFNDKWTWGPEAGYNLVTATESNVSSTTKGYIIGARANWYPKSVYRNGWYLSPSLDYASLNVSSVRGSVTGSGTYNTFLAQGSGGYHFFLADFNISFGIGYQYTSQSSISLKFNDGTSKDFSYNSQGWIYEATLGWLF